MDTYPTNLMPSTLAQVQALDNSIVGAANQSCHCSWVPDSSVNTMCTPATTAGVQVQVTWRYDNWNPIGYSNAGAKVTNITNMSDLVAVPNGTTTGTYGQRQMLFNVPGISVVINGAANAGVGQQFIIRIVQHLELTAFLS